MTTYNLLQKINILITPNQILHLSKNSHVLGIISLFLSLNEIFSILKINEMFKNTIQNLIIF